MVTRRSAVESRRRRVRRRNGAIQGVGVVSLAATAEADNGGTVQAVRAGQAAVAAILGTDRTPGVLPTRAIRMRADRAAERQPQRQSGLDDFAAADLLGLVGLLGCELLGCRAGQAAPAGRP